MDLICVICAAGFSGHGSAKYCSNRCRNVYREKRRGPTCTGCGTKMYAAHHVAASPMCQPCRRARPGYRDKTKGRIQSWSCAGCGEACTRPAVKGTPPKWCGTCREIARHREIKVSVAERFAIYESDDWTCWLCRGAVDRSLIRTKSPWKPSLDHVLPRAHGGSDDISNLRLAHWWCNSARSDGRTYEPEFFNVAS